MKDKIWVYLSGANKQVIAKERNSWRYKAMRFFRDNDLVQYEVFNPNIHFSYELDSHLPSKVIMDYFIKKVGDSDILLLNLNNTDKSIGTAMEVQKAVDSGVLIIGFDNQNSYDYIVDCCSIVLPTLEEALEFIKIHLYK